MLIAINGTIINTNNIYQITPIITGYYEFTEDSTRFVQKENKIIALNINKFDIILFNKHVLTFENVDITKLSTFRNSIIKIWNENQTKIPNFIIEN